MKDAFTIEYVFKLIIKYKYYFITTIVLAYVLASLHVLNVNKNYETFINIKMSPEYLSIDENIKKSDFIIYGQMFEEEFFDEENLNSFFDSETSNIVNKINKNSNTKFLKIPGVKIKVLDDF